MTMVADIRDHIHAFISSSPNAHSLILMAGDFKVTLSSSRDRTSGRERNLRYAEQLRSLVIDFDFRDVCEDIKPGQTAYTSQGGNMVMSLPLEKPRSPYWRFDNSLLLNEDYCSFAKQLLTGVCLEVPRIEEDDISKWELIKDEIKEHAIMYKRNISKGHSSLELDAFFRTEARSIVARAGWQDIIANGDPAAPPCCSLVLQECPEASESPGGSLRIQSYCVPGRTIFDSIAIIRDIVRMKNRRSQPLAIISLDKSKAFDMVNHKYLFSVPARMGFGKSFLGMIATLYTEAVCMARTASGLTTPIPIRRGIGQGCPLSGQLYSLAIEPLVRRLKGMLARTSLSNDDTLTVSVYADDNTFSWIVILTFP
ncbi:hypothetical protein J437_LFUL012518 [Ladona fulva]|uniref:Reverse transcriptase domain-containing protein n=1 Tax=Ladona fulva TaxID=123851 RepID=A0A8K0K2G9_LADFU|nr:hypothetical protein J437_LFUL012518 [Ladona fulva]